MRLNRYTYIIDYDKDHFVIFNGLNKSFKVVNKTLESSFESILENPNSYKKSHPQTIQGLYDIGIVVDDGYDEFKEVNAVYENFIAESAFKVVILPTYECNYKCWYCTQKHEPVEIDEHKLQKIILFIKRYLTENSINTLLLSWFGGEPLTQPEIINRMSSELLRFCEANNILFQGGITSNGALLSDDVIEMLKNNQISGYQITIDGDRKNHNKTKNDQKNPSSFDLVINNLVRLANSYPSASITLRLNITPKMVEDTHLVDEINELIPEHLRDRFYVDIHHIWQIDERNYSSEKLLNLHRAFVTSGYILENHNIFSICYVDKQHYACIFYNGKVELCDNMPIDKLRGYITDEGFVKWNVKPTLYDKHILSSDSPCRDCEFLPLCFGGCPSQREGYMNKYGKIVCPYSNKDSLFEHRIKDYCSRTLNNLAIIKPQ